MTNETNCAHLRVKFTKTPVRQPFSNTMVAQGKWVCDCCQAEFQIVAPRQNMYLNAEAFAAEILRTLSHELPKVKRGLEKERESSERAKEELATALEDQRTKQIVELDNCLASINDLWRRLHDLSRENRELNSLLIEEQQKVLHLRSKYGAS